MRTALVVSGGGSKGAFAVGVIKYILKNTPIRFDLFCGTSTGSLIVPLVALGELDLLETIYTTKKTEDIILTGNVIKRFAQNNSLFDAKPLANLIQNTYTAERYNQLIETRKPVFLTTVSLQSGRLTYFSTLEAPLIEQPEYDVITIPSHDIFVRAVLASAEQPVFMQPIEIPKDSGKQYVDGGVQELTPIQLAIENGATHIYAITLSPAESQPLTKKYDSVLDILLRTIDLFSLDISTNDIKFPLWYNRTLTYLAHVKTRVAEATGLSPQEVDALFDSNDNLFQGKVPINLNIIRPIKTLDGGPGGLDFDPVKMKDMLAQGEAAAKDFFNNHPLPDEVIV
ncbi:MAG: patatin-like phospholipase family protein [Bacteroidota bacterium]